ncbi:methyl-accepting chemotaxis protein [Paenibacillus baekrokdamisoli]|uniref:Methyl-accepting chemotaxis protein n=1 Tax=Paenibacillus baekrokdamisoli TaxID=1712516 RepID=A0A3G9J2Y5_9BACL|nr:methyl-accepting chemotaxis protein [Paenibacillus baekrokdamisoli]MBB3072791.1 methyl-accepting chemotaxis protein [Paenibacillus baekrokdamisoli]BBH20181.1 methyl-accepting chemotaxis protein [Paenibacillus baekrokdamisoli]
MQPNKLHTNSTTSSNPFEGPKPPSRYNKWFHSLRTRLTFWFLVIGLIPLVVSSSIIYYTTASDHVESEVSVYRNLTENKANTVLEWVDQRTSELMLTSQNEMMRSNDRVKQSEYLKVLQNLSSISSDIMLTDASGKVLLHSNMQQEVTSIADQEYFKTAMQGETNVSDVIISKSTGEPAVALTVPIMDASGKKPIGVLTNIIAFDSMMDHLFKDLVIAKGAGYPIMLDNQGIIRYAQQKEAIGRTPQESNLPDGLKAILSNPTMKDNVADYTVNNETYIVTYSPLADTGFKLYFHMPLNSILVSQAKTETTLYTILLIAGGITIIIALLIVLTITRPIGKITKQVKRIAAGDLTEDHQRIKNKDEIGELANDINTMTTSLKTMVGHLRGNAHKVAETAEMLDTSAGNTRLASDQIATAMEQVATGSEVQLQGAMQSSQAMNELAASIQRISESSSVVSDTAVEAGNDAIAGSETLQITIGQMNSISQSVGASAELVRQLGERSAEIEQIITVMSGIASQTNILALNAGIEAARAGEHGKGFAVVASEVKKLAEQSNQSAEQISELIGQISRTIGHIVDSMNRGVGEVDKGIVSVQEVGEVFRNIVHSVQNVTEQIQEISATSQEISASTQQVTASMSEMVAISRSSANIVQTVMAASEEQFASVEQVSSSAEQLSGMANELQNEVGKFKL